MNKAILQLIKQMRTFKLPDGSIDPDGGRTTFIIQADGSKLSHRQIAEAMIAGMRQALK